MPVTRRHAIVLAFAVVAAACSGSGSESAAESKPRQQRLSARPSASRAPLGIPVIETTLLPDSPDRVRSLQTDGKHLYLYREINNEPTSYARVDPKTGQVLAEIPIRPLPAGLPYDSPAAVQPTGDEVLFADGERSVILVLDPDTLQLRRRIALPPNTRTDLIRVAGPNASIWIGHRRYDADILAGITARLGISLIDPDAGRVVETKNLPPCGAKGAVQVGELLVFSPECTNQLTVTNLESGTSEVVPSFQHDTDLHPIRDTVWLRWTELGFIARFDPKTKAMETIDLNAGGPLLQSAGIAKESRGSLWAFGHPADTDLSSVIYRIDPDAVTVTARGWLPAGSLVLGEFGYTVKNGRLARFRLSDVEGGAPSDLVRPSPVESKPFTPRAADEREVLQTFSLVFDPNVSNAEAAPYLERTPGLDALRSNLVDLARRIGPSLKLIVTHVTVGDDNATVSYSYMLDGKIAFVPFVGSLRRVDDKWLVSRDSLCRLAEQAAVKGC
jgi:hypothetical protein